VSSGDLATTFVEDDEHARAKRPADAALAATRHVRKPRRKLMRPR
jgi:hypothetical protein